MRGKIFVVVYPSTNPRNSPAIAPRNVLPVAFMIQETNLKPLNRLKGLLLSKVIRKLRAKLSDVLSCVASKFKELGEIDP
jgi:hypothetical protein